MRETAPQLRARIAAAHDAALAQAERAARDHAECAALDAGHPLTLDAERTLGRARDMQDLLARLTREVRGYDARTGLGRELLSRCAGRAVTYAPLAEADARNVAQCLAELRATLTTDAAA